MKNFFRIIPLILFISYLIFISKSSGQYSETFLNIRSGIESPYGIVSHALPAGANGHATMDLAVDAGIKWIRAGQDWRYIEKMEPDGSIWWNWSVLDEIVDYANANGLNILLGCFSTPAHYGVSYNYLPNHLVYAWERFLRELVTRYKNRGVKYWGIWNEPNLNHFWAGTNDEYIYNVLIPAARTIKSIDIDAKICAPDLSSAGNNKAAKTWINSILQKAGGYIDVITHQRISLVF